MKDIGSAARRNLSAEDEIRIVLVHSLAREIAGPGDPQALRQAAE